MSTEREEQVRATRPPVSSPSVTPKRRPAEYCERYAPFLSTLAKRSSSASRFTRTPLKRMLPLSTPCRPTCEQQS